MKIPVCMYDFDNSPRCYVQDCKAPHPYLHDTVAWMQFIRKYVKLPNYDGIFTAEGNLKLHPRGEIQTQDYRDAFCEEYSKNGEPVFRIFLDNDAGWARIECFDIERFNDYEHIRMEILESMRDAA
jgi:hypothetical protein